MTVWGAAVPVSGMPFPPRREDSSRVAQSVLVVDDQDVVRNVVRLALERAGFSVLEAESPTGAIALVREHRQLDLVIADVVMPEMDAFELVRLLVDELPGLRVLYMSGYADAREEGPFIQKPFTPSALVEKVQEVLSDPA